MTVKLGQVGVVGLPEHVAERYNAENSGQPAVEAGTERPYMVVGVDADGKTANVRLFHDGAGDHYVQAVPWDVLEGDTTTEESPEDPPAGSQWDPAKDGTGQTYVGQGPGAPVITQPDSANVQSPFPGQPVNGGVTNPASNDQWPSK